MSKFCFWLIVGVIGLAFALGYLGVGKIWAAVLIIGLMLLALVMKYYFIPLILFFADALQNGIHEAVERRVERE